MEHEHIEEHQVVERYLMGTLDEDEAARFEEHYLHCAHCLEQLEVTEALRQGLREAAAEEVAAVAMAGGAGFLAGLRRMHRSQRLALLFVGLAVVIAVALPWGVLYQENRSLKQQLDFALQHQPAAADPELVASLEERLGAQQARLEQLREQVQAASRSLTETLEQARLPQVNTAVLALALERSGGGSGSDPSHVVRLSGEPEWIVLSLELDPPVGERYGLTLHGPDRGAIWSSDELVPNSFDSLNFSVHSSTLAAGVHEARVEEVRAAGERVPAGTFRFRVEKRQ